MPTVDLTARLAREINASGKDIILFDKALPGFGLRIHPSGRKVWIVQARIEGRSRRVVIARYEAMRLTQARRRARDMLDRIRAGENPANDIQREKQTPTFREFTKEYLRRSDPHWKPSGRKTVRVYLKARILPTFGRMPLDRIGPEDVAEWFDVASKDKPGAANRALEILRAMIFRAEEWGLRKRDTNPCLGIAMNPRNRVARFLDADELARLGRALAGSRKPDSFLFPSYARGKGYESMRNCWRAVCTDAKLGSLRPHDLRHTTASQAVMSGENLPLVGKLLGHNRHRTTAGYAHLADAHLVAAAETVGRAIAEAMARHLIRT